MVNGKYNIEIKVKGKTRSVEVTAAKIGGKRFNFSDGMVIPSMFSHVNVDIEFVFYSRQG